MSTAVSDISLTIPQLRLIVVGSMVTIALADNAPSPVITPAPMPVVEPPPPPAVPETVPVATTLDVLV